MSDHHASLQDQAEVQKAVPAPDCTLVIFGAHGDLTKRLLMPALYNLRAMGLLGEGMKIIGVDHSDGDTAQWSGELTAMMQSFAKDKTGEFHPDSIDEGSWGWVRGKLEYVKGDFDDAALFSGLAGRISGNAMFYLAVAARFFGPVVQQLGKAGMLKESNGAFRRVVIEKPFGHDLGSAQALNRTILAEADESQFFRIDHFMGKEAVQTILPFRFSNSQFEPIWRREYVEYVEISAAETVGVEGRGGFYEQTGALRDMVPNHLFTVLSMVAMEPPTVFDAEAVRSEKARVLEALGKVGEADIVRGQYGAGSVLGKDCVAYTAEPDVKPDSQTETYVALKLSVNNWRWEGVPFYLRTGKHMNGRRTEVVVHFKHPAVTLLPANDGESPRSTMTIRIDPDQETVLRINAKTPGVLTTLAPVEMVFRYTDYFPMPSRVGYEGLFYGAMTGDRTLFQRADAIEAGWAALNGVLQAPPALSPYASGTAGPEAADALLAKQGHAWTVLS